MRFWSQFLFAGLTLQIYAVPMRPYVFRAKMSDGTYRNIRCCGDERGRFYVDEDGFVVKKDASGNFYVTSLKPSDFTAVTRDVRAAGIGVLENAPIKSIGHPNIPVILVNFSDLKMTVAPTEEEVTAYYDKYFNGTGNGELYTGAGSMGAVRDYFAIQSDSLFLPEFDVIGPVTLDKPMAYYGQDTDDDIDIHFGDFCKEALEQAIVLRPDLKTKFDNDGNGTMDLAFFVYAGLSETAPNAPKNAIWPKEDLEPLKIDDITIAVSACSSELLTVYPSKKVDGIGTACHEICHSLGLPDEYDLNYKALGMSYW
ncbi:MAG: immune inhibitor A [Paraprevotella sp.]|nr:immune inhibitor A [Paraprevotella sp.]